MNVTKNFIKVHDDGIRKCLTGNYEEGFQIIKSLAEEGNDFSAFNYAVLLYNEGKFNEAFKWMEKAAEAGVKSAIANLCTMYYKGEGVKCDVKKTVEWAEVLINNGEIDNGYMLVARAYLEASDEKQIDYEKCFEYAKEGTQMIYDFNPIPHKKVSCDIVCLLGLCYALGIGVDKKINKALKHLTYCEKCGDKDASTFIGEILCDKNNKEYYNLNEGIKKYLKAIRKGNNEAYYFLAKLYFENDEIKDYNKAKYYSDLYFKHGQNDHYLAEIKEIMKKTQSKPVVDNKQKIF